jgi:hypothetical protein
VTEEGNTHMPLLQVIRSFDLLCRVGRLALYHQFKREKSVNDAV